MMSRGFIALVGALVGTIAVPMSGWTQTYHHYDCTDGASFELAFYPETKAAYLQIDGKSLQLPKRFSLTTQRFARAGVTLSLRSGGRATVRRAGKTSDCTAK